MRTAAKRDGNEGTIVGALQKMGVIVVKVSAPGLPDLLCFHEFTGLFLLEVKKDKGTLTPAQLKSTLPFHVVRTEEEAIAVFWAQVRRFQ